MVILLLLAYVSTMYFSRVTVPVKVSVETTSPRIQCQEVICRPTRDTSEGRSKVLPTETEMGLGCSSVV